MSESADRSLAPPVVAILAGGLASRLGPVARERPKSLLPVAGEPFLVHQLRSLASQGFTRIVVCAGHLGEQIEQLVGDGEGFGCQVGYSFDGPAALGTGGALLRALPLLGDNFLVMYGDSYLQEPVAPIWKSFLAAGKAGLMTVLRNEGRWDRSNILFAAGQIAVYDKSGLTPGMAHVDYGLGCIRTKALEGWATADRFDLEEFYRALLERGELAAFEVKERFYEIGSVAGLAETEALLSSLRERH